MFRNLELKLLLSIGIFLIIFIFLVIIFFINTRKRSNNYFDNEQLKLRYFIQKQVDYHNQVTGYECLLRQHNEDGTWTLPQNMDGLPLQRVISLLEETFKSLPDTKISLSINLSYAQIMSPEFIYFVRWAISKIEPMQLMVEYHADYQVLGIRKHRFSSRIKMAQNYGMQFAIDNVGSKLSNLKNIEWMLPVIDTLKCSMKSFRKEDPSIWLDLNLQFWNQLSKDNDIELLLMGIESKQDEALARQLKINLRQGYLFGRPVKTN